MANYPLKLVGHTSWTGGAEPDVVDWPINRAFIRSENTIVYGCEVKGYLYDVSLNSADGIHFTGKFQGRLGTTVYNIEAEATLYSNTVGFLLYGTWIENYSKYKWLVQLHFVDKFADES